MKSAVVLAMCLSVPAVAPAQANPLVVHASPRNSAMIVKGYGDLPLVFEANQGQTDPPVNFLSRGAGYSLFLTPNEAVLSLREGPRQGAPMPAQKARALPDETSQHSNSSVLRMKLVGANVKAQVIGQDELGGKSNYFIGKDPDSWHRNIRQFAKVRYKNVYPGIDLVYYGHERELEYDFVLQPGTNPETIRLGIAGARRLRLKHGELVLSSAGGELHLRSPKIYQLAEGTRHEVRGGYVLSSKNEVSFRVSSYDRRKALVIDPVLAYSSYFGVGAEAGYGIALDSAGNAYITGYTGSSNFPTKNAIQPKFGGGFHDAFVTKMNADGSALVYSTYLGGSGSEIGFGIAVDSAGNAYVTGTTGSTDFPIKNALQPTFSGSYDAFVTKISADGSALVYSTYLGGNGSSAASGIAVDPPGNAYVIGQTNSTDFPIKNALQSTLGGSYDAFVTKISADGSAFIYSTYLGGTKSDYGLGIAVDPGGNAYVTGSTISADFPVKNALQSTFSGGNDAFVTKISADGSALVYSTYLGGGVWNGGAGIAVGSGGNAYVTGTTSSTDFPVKNAFQPTIGGRSDAFLTAFSPDGALVYSTYLGGNGDENSGGIAVDAAGDAYVTGFTTSSDFPTKNAYQRRKHFGWDAFITEINPGGNALIYSTYLGGNLTDVGYGIAVDSAGSSYVTGQTGSSDFPTTLLAFQPSVNGNPDAFVTKFAQQTFVSVSSSTRYFSTQLVGTTSVAQQVTVTNIGPGTIKVNKIFFGGTDPSDFSATSTCTTLASGANCTISITFKPTAPGPRNAVVGVSDSDPASPQTFKVTGTGTVVSLSKSQLSFGNQKVGTTSPPKSITLTNVGSAQLTFTSISITGANPGDYSQTNTCGTAIAAHASCTFTVTFTPTVIGSRQATLSITDNGGASPQKVGLTGTGI